MNLHATGFEVRWCTEPGCWRVRGAIRPTMPEAEHGLCQYHREERRKAAARAAFEARRAPTTPEPPVPPAAAPRALEYDASVVSAIAAIPVDPEPPVPTTDPPPPPPPEPEVPCASPGCPRPRARSRAGTREDLAALCAVCRVIERQRALIREAPPIEYEPPVARPMDAPPRPLTWGDCQERGLGTPSTPCPYATCKYSLVVDYDNASGRLRQPHFGLEINQLRHTCALRVAAAGGVTLEDVGEVLGVTRERVRQIEYRAIRRVRMASRFPHTRAGRLATEHRD